MNVRAFGGSREFSGCQRVNVASEFPSCMEQLFSTSHEWLWWMIIIINYYYHDPVTIFWPRTWMALGTTDYESILLHRRLVFRLHWREQRVKWKHSIQLLQEEEMGPNRSCNPLCWIGSFTNAFTQRSLFLGVMVAINDLLAWFVKGKCLLGSWYTNWWDDCWESW